MPILLDTNVLIEFLRQVPAAVAWFRSLDERPTMSAISVLELCAGVRNQREERDVLALRHLVNCLPIGQEIAEGAASIVRHFHKSHGVDIPDAIIAATAEHHGLRLATLNVRHFPMFPKLKRAY